VPERKWFWYGPEGRVFANARFTGQGCEKALLCCQGTSRIDNYKAISSKKFQNGPSAFCFSLRAGRIIEGLVFTFWAMDQDHRSAALGHAGFDATRWSVVLEAAKSRAAGGPEAARRLCERNVPSFAVNTPIISDTPSDEYPTGRCGLQVRDDVFLQFGILELSVRFFPFRERTPD
jgi:hypothetical protein